MITVKIVLDERRKNDDEIYPVKLRITNNRQQKYYLTGIKMTRKDFEQTMKDVPIKKYRNNKIELDAIVLKSKNVIKDLQIFSFIGFEKKFLNDNKPDETLFELYLRVFNEKMSRGEIGTAIGYRCSMKSLQAFNNKLTYVDITPDLLHKYERKLLDDGKQTTTVGIYIRPLRAIINEAILLGYFPRDLYPFGRKRYVIPEGRNIKKALDKVDFKKIWNYQCTEEFSIEARSKDFFILSYLCQGANIKDLLLMKKEQLSDTEIYFIRQKTKETSRKNPILITVPLLDDAKKIIKKWECKSEKTPFVFNFINQDMTPLQIYKTSMQFIQTTNKNLKRIGQALGIRNNITTYVARHQFSKAIIEGGESVAYLSECLGHRNTLTTQHYIQRFSMMKKMETAKKLLLN